MPSPTLNRAQVYVDRVNDLYGRIEETMKAIDPGARFIRESLTLNEESAGVYEAPAMIIHTSDGENIRFVPRGSTLIGAAGRVDISSLRGSEVLVYIEGNPVIKFNVKVGTDVESRETSLRKQTGNGWAWAIDKFAKDIPLLDQPTFSQLIKKLKG